MLKIAECRPEVQAFAVAMEEKLRANDHKGGWKGCCPLWLFQRAEDELEGLRAEMPYHLHGQYGCLPAPFAESHPLVGFPDDLNQSHGGMCICWVLGIGPRVSQECLGP